MVYSPENVFQTSKKVFPFAFRHQQSSASDFIIRYLKGIYPGLLDRRQPCIGVSILTASYGVCACDCDFIFV